MKRYEYKMTDEIKEKAAKNAKFARWAVAWIVDASNYDDRQDHVIVSAVFTDPNNAEMYIDCFPEEVQSRLFITRIS